MIHIKSALQRVPTLGAAATLLLAAVIPAVSLTRSASAAALTERGLTVTSTVASDDLTAPDGSTYTGLAAGDPRNGAQVGHKYTFKAATSGVVKGFTIEYCTTAFGFVGDGACAAPSSFSASNWDGKTITIDSGTFTVEANAANYLTLTSTGGTTNLTGGTSVVEMDFDAATGYFVNPDDSYRTGLYKGTYFAHISTFGSEVDAGAAFDHESPNPANPEDPAGIRDDGTVTNSVTRAIGIYTRVQETLNFSVEGDAASQYNGTPGTPTPAGAGCDPLIEPGLLKMGDTNSALVANTANKVTSYFRLSTNAVHGTDVSYSGDTLKSTNHTFLTSAPAGEAYSPGAERFGLGVNIDAMPLTDLTAASGYGGAGTANSFAFDTGSIADPEPIASKVSGVVACDTGRVDYMASIAPETPAGIYQTKINYIASPRY